MNWGVRRQMCLIKTANYELLRIRLSESRRAMSWEEFVKFGLFGIEAANQHLHVEY